jgi:citrate lyase subunit beta/citryl-CoA lyase
MPALGVHAPAAGMTRSWLFVPGDDERKIARAWTSGADALIFDWEDSVAASRKAHARHATAAALAAAPPSPPACWIRVNALTDPHHERDLAALPAARIAGIVLPKACGTDALATIDRLLAEVEQRTGVRQAQLRVVAIVTETARSVLALSAMREPQPRLVGLMWGGEDLSADLGAQRNRDDRGHYRDAFRLARALTLLAAAATECEAIDAVHIDFRDLSALARETADAKADGFAGKAAIHPAQVPVIHAALAPTAEELAWAERVCAAVDATTGVTVVDGRMVDAPHVKLARRIVAARAANA